MDERSRFWRFCLVALPCVLLAQPLWTVAASPAGRVPTCLGRPVTMLGTRDADRIAGTMDAT